MAGSAVDPWGDREDNILINRDTGDECDCNRCNRRRPLRDFLDAMKRGEDRTDVAAWLSTRQRLPMDIIV